jgi:pyruvate ferredoxin oxidoreductase gamma subunit
MIEIRLHGRGGQGAVTANEILAEAAYYDGKYAQAIPMYGTERRGAPVTAFLRLDNVRVRERDLVHEPDIVVILDPLLSQRPACIEGLKKGGLVIANYPYPAEKIPLGGDFKITSIDATQIAMDTLGRPITNTAILGAFSKATGLIRMESIEKAVMHRFPGRMGEMNVNAVRKAYELTPPAIQAKGEVRKDEEGLAGGGYGTIRSAAGWRTFRPVWDYDKCIRCRICWISCPDNAIDWVEDKPTIDYRKCKGCGICTNECPTKAIEFKREVI